MRLHVALGFLTLAGCATVPSPRGEDGSGGTVAAEPHALAEPVRLETRSGTFLVHPDNAQDFQKRLVGEPTQQRYSASILLAGEWKPSNTQRASRPRPSWGAAGGTPGGLSPPG